MLHIYAGDTLGLKKGKGLPPLPNEVADTAIVKYDDAGNPIPVGQIEKKTAGDIVPEQEVQYSGEHLTGDFNSKLLKNKSLSERSDILSEIKDARNKSFDKLINEPTLQGIDQNVIAVAQGDFRVKAKHEIDPANEVDVKAFYDVAKSLQKKYDDLKERYKDKPAMQLFHGQSMGMERVADKGFTDPQVYKGIGHQELGIGGISFTKDIGLGATAGSFGGRIAKNYVYTEMPYADYIFTRINMPSDKYALKDMNTIARTITGSPTVVRPMSLPRGAFNETEDVFVEAEKLKTKGKDGDLALKSAIDVLDKPLREGGKGKLETTAARLDKLKQDRELLRDYTEVVSDFAVPLKERRKMAYMSYNLIKSITTDMLGAAESVSTGKGLGQTYQTNLSRFADQVSLSEKINDVIGILNNMGAVQKANALEKVRVQLKSLSEQTGGFTADKDVIKTLNETRAAASKLAKGGFISKR
jgi:hypothetical protein